MQDKIFIYLDHSIGYMQSTLLNYQLTHANWPTQLAILVNFNTKTQRFSMLFPEYTHSGIRKPNLLKACFKNFIIKHELKENQELDITMFRNFIHDLKSTNTLNLDRNGWYLFIDINLGQPNLDYMTGLFDEIVHFFGDYGSTLNLYPHSENDNACKEGEIYLAGGITQPYVIDQQTTGNFQLKINIQGFVERKRDLRKALGHYETPISEISLTDKQELISRSSPLFFIDNPAPQEDINFSYTPCSNPSPLSEGTYLATCRASVDDEPLPHLALSSHVKPTSTRSWYDYFCSFFVSTSVKTYIDDDKILTAQAHS